MLLILSSKGHEVITTEKELELAQQLFAGTKKVVSVGNQLERAQQLQGHTIHEATFNSRGGIEELLDVVKPVDMVEEKQYVAMLPVAGG